MPSHANNNIRSSPVDIGFGRTSLRRQHIRGNLSRSSGHQLRSRAAFVRLQHDRSLLGPSCQQQPCRSDLCLHCSSSGIQRRCTILPSRQRNRTTRHRHRRRRTNRQANTPHNLDCRRISHLPSRCRLDIVRPCASDGCQRRRQPRSSDRSHRRCVRWSPGFPCISEVSYHHSHDRSFTRLITRLEALLLDYFGHACIIGYRNGRILHCLNTSITPGWRNGRLDERRFHQRRHRMGGN